MGGYLLITNACIRGSIGSSGPETVKTYTGNVSYVLKSVLNDLLGSAVAQTLMLDFGVDLEDNKALKSCRSSPRSIFWGSSVLLQCLNRKVS